MKKLRNVLALLLTAVIAISAVTVTAYADPFEDAIAIDSGDTVKGKLESSVTYEITAKSSGTLTVDWSVGKRCTEIHVFDEDGSYINIEKLNIKAGEIATEGWYVPCGGEGEDYVRGVWNKTSERFSATATYKVKKGTYYITLSDYYSNNGNGDYKLTATYPTKSGNTFSYLGITMKKGDTLQLEAVGASGEDTTWTSSKKSVVSVTSKGKITAKKKGTAIITCESNGIIIKLKVTVK